MRMPRGDERGDVVVVVVAWLDAPLPAGSSMDCSAPMVDLWLVAAAGSCSDKDRASAFD